MGGGGPRGNPGASGCLETTTAVRALHLEQVIGRLTGLDRADFNSHQARRVLSRLGFTVGRGVARIRRRPRIAPARSAAEKPTFSGPSGSNG